MAAKKQKRSSSETHEVKVKKGNYEVTIRESGKRARKVGKKSPKKKMPHGKTKSKKVRQKTHASKAKKSPKKKATEVRYHSTKEIKVERALIDNFIALQKVMVNMSSKFDRLSNEISKLLNIFEISAKAMARKEFASESDPGVKKVLERLDNISQQAGLIGKGLALIHEVNKEEGHHLGAAQTIGPPRNSQGQMQIQHQSQRGSSRRDLGEPSIMTKSQMQKPAGMAKPQSQQASSQESQAQEDNKNG